MERMTLEEYRLARKLWATGCAILCLVAGSLMDALSMGAVIASYMFLFVRFTAWISEDDLRDEKTVVIAPENGKD